MFAFIKKCVVLLGIAVLIISSTASATEFICYDFDNSEGTLNAVGLQRNAENAIKPVTQLEVYSQLNR